MLTAVRRYSGQGLKPAIYPETAKTEAVRLRPGSYVAGQALGAASNLAAANDVQTLSVAGTPTGGSFILLFNGDTLGPIAYNANAAAIQALIDAHPQLGTVNGTQQVIVTGGALPGTPIVFTFSGSTVASFWQPLFTVFSNSLTGGTNPAPSVAHTTPGRAAGGQWGKYDPTASDGMEKMRAFLKNACTVDINGMIHYGPSNARDSGRAYTADVYIKGYFRTADITGIDAAGIADIGARIIWGDESNLASTATVISVF